MKKHDYHIQTKWTGNTGRGTASYTSYDRDFCVSGAEKSGDIQGSSDPVFRGNPSRYNPEELYVSAISSCHMLWYLHLCSDAGIIVTNYVDNAKGVMVENKGGSGQFSEVVLFPQVEITDPEQVDAAIALHKKAHRYCFIANSCSATILCRPSVTVNTQES